MIWFQIAQLAVLIVPRQSASHENDQDVANMLEMQTDGQPKRPYEAHESESSRTQRSRRSRVNGAPKTELVMGTVN